MAKIALQRIEQGDTPAPTLTKLQQMTDAANSNFTELYTGVSGTYTIGGGASGDVATLTVENGRITAVTTVP